jgi:DNA-binding NtrC family response regulator
MEGDERGADGHGLRLLLMSPDVFASQPLPTTGAVTIGRSSRSAIQIEDPMASREHARLHVAVEASVPRLAVEDLGSANGTHVRDASIAKGQLVPIQVGEAVLIGGTVLMVLPGGVAAGPRHIQTHAYFEARVADACVRADPSKDAFALMRLRFSGAAPWSQIVPVLVRDLTAPHVFAAYGPKDYEIFFSNVDEAGMDALSGGLLRSFAAAGLDAACGVAWYPKSGRTSDALLAAANAQLATKSTPTRTTGENAATDLAPMQRVRELAARVAASPINVLILGECGVGKDVLAQLIHKLSPRADKAFVAFNCAGLAPSLIESELFGHDKSAFTGASAGGKVGLLESANGGTVFLDEVGDMPLEMQPKLLRVFEAREVKPVGSPKHRPIDVRFIAATNKDLDVAVAKGEFREDLKFRLDVMTLVVPPLRERLDEVPSLAKTFVANACRERGTSQPGPMVISDAVLEALVRYRWPGNIRELKNVMERAVALCDGNEILLEHLPLEKMSASPHRGVRAASDTLGLSAAEIIQGMPALTDPEKMDERRRMIEALVASNWNQTRAAARMGIPRRTFVSKLDLYGIPRPQKRPSQGSKPEDRRGNDLLD